MGKSRFKKNLTILVMGALNFIFSFLVVSKLNNTLPLKFYNDGIDMMCSKYLLYIIPGIVILLSVLQVIYRLNTMDKPVNTFRIIEDALFCLVDGSLIAFNWMLIYRGCEYTANPIITSLKINPIHFVLVAIGIIICSIYSTFPINKKGSIIGLRTKETMQDNEIWRIANRFNGFTGFVSGLLIILMNVYCIVNKNLGINMIITFVVAAILMFVVPVIYTKIIAKKMNEEIV